MRVQKLKKQVYVINPRNMRSVDMEYGEWITSPKIDIELEKKLRSNKVSCVFLKEQNVFAHYMNRFRSILKATDTIALVGVDELITILDAAQKCRLDFTNYNICIDGVAFGLNSMDLHDNVSEIIEYNLDSGEICYKPDYYYDERLARIIVQGYNRIPDIFQKPHRAVFLSDRRIWSLGFVFPSDFFELFANNKSSYYKLMDQYCKVLKMLLWSCKEPLDMDSLIANLVPHYTYSIIFSLIAPNIVKKMVEHDIIIAIAAVSDNTPFQETVGWESMKEILDISLENLSLFLASLQAEVSPSKSYCEIYKKERDFDNPWVAMLFVTNLLQDVRRGVINEVRRNYSWFEAICGHRKGKNSLIERI